MKNALTIDLEEWFHIFDVERYRSPECWDALESRIEPATRIVLETLARAGVRATFFVLGWIARRHPDLVRQIEDEGHEIGSHGYFHVRAFDADPDGVRRDIEQSIDALESIGAAHPRGYRAPEWSIIRETAWLWEVLAELGFRYSSSTVPLTGMGQQGFPALPYRVETAAGAIDEFPISTMRAFFEGLPYTGGLPLRCAPYWYIVEKIRYENRCGHPVMVYVHPWEFDPAHPPMELPLGRRFMHFWNMRSTPKKLAGLLRHFAFAPVAEVLEQPTVRSLIDRSPARPPTGEKLGESRGQPQDRKAPRRPDPGAAS
jgi:polysaccharide deacetylase family protein (PEP-CTERM system associated)